MDVEAEQGCTNVSVEGDATYCIEGAICGGNGSACPKQGDWASGDCKTGLFSSKNGWCQAPESAVCLTLKTGARGCVYPSKGPQKMVADMAADAEQGCTNVSVEGDATYCVNGPVCSGNSGGGACPKKGDWASGDCKTGLYSSQHGWCQAPETATCQKLKTGAWGCVYPSKGPQKMEAHLRSGHELSA
ncbi:hypothetical protein SPRG_16847, partial [Saprolegnia parasitica CBS 223.65]